MGLNVLNIFPAAVNSLNVCILVEIQVRSVPEAEANGSDHKYASVL